MQQKFTTDLEKISIQVAKRSRFMKIAILAAGDSSRYFPIFIDKPKCLYHLNGKIQLERVIEDVKCFVPEKDIIVVAGYKYKQIEKFLKKYPEIDFRVNEKFREPAILSFRKAIEGIEDDVVFMFGDESISRTNVGKIVNSKRKLAIMCHDNYYYYSLGIIKLRKDQINILNDDKYLSMDEMKKIYCFANNKKEYDGVFNINSGVCIGYIMIDIINRIGAITKIENPVITYKGEDIDFIHYNPDEEYFPDLDHIEDTDEYKKNLWMKIYVWCISKPIKKIIRILKRIFG